MMRRWLKSILVAILVVTIAACQSTAAPQEFAPDGEIVQKAIAFQFERSQRQLSKQLQTEPASFKIAQINVQKLDPIVIGKLPTYRLKGTYQLTLNLRHQAVTQQKNPFEIYLQRQIEGETWRLLLKNSQTTEPNRQWTSYLIE